MAQGQVESDPLVYFLRLVIVSFCSADNKCTHNSRLSGCLELTRKHSSPAPSSGGFIHKIDKTSVNHLVITIHQASAVAIETCNKLIKPDQNCKGKINITDIIISAAKRTRKRPMSVSKANCIFPSARVNCI